MKPTKAPARRIAAVETRERADYEARHPRSAAVAGLKGEVGRVDAQVSQLVAELDRAIAEANRFIAELEQ